MQVRTISSDVEEIELTLLKPSPFSTRTSNDYMIEELIRSIKENGLLYPLIIRPRNDYFEVICGNRRLNAIKKLRWKRVPVKIMDVDDKTAFELALIENLQRKNLNPIEEARAYKAYVERIGWGGVTELAKKIGKSQEYVSRRLSLLSLPKEVQDMLVEGSVSPSLASELVGLDPSLQKRISLEAKKGIVKVRDVRMMKNRLKEKLLWYDPDEAVKILDKSIIILRIALIRMSSILSKLEPNNFLWTLLMEEKNMLSKQVDGLIRLKLKKSKIERLL